MVRSERTAAPVRRVKCDGEYPNAESVRFTASQKLRTACTDDLCCGVQRTIRTALPLRRVLSLRPCPIPTHTVANTRPPDHPRVVRSSHTTIFNSLCELCAFLTYRYLLSTSSEINSLLLSSACAAAAAAEHQHQIRCSERWIYFKY